MGSGISDRAQEAGFRSCGRHSLSAAADRRKKRQDDKKADSFFQTVSHGKLPFEDPEEDRIVLMYSYCHYTVRFSPVTEKAR